MIEHVVLYRFKPETEPSQIAATINGLNDLVSIKEVVHLSAGPLLRTHSSSSLSFTHMLHCRYNSQEDLKAYAVHPAHVSLVNRTIVLLDDIMAVDWITEDASAPAPGSVSKVVFLKLKDNLAAQKDYVLEVIRETWRKLSSIRQFSFGENFSLDRAKGFSIAILMVFDGVEVLNSSAEIVNLLNEKLKDMVVDDLVLDYVMETPQSGSSI
ncbi:hypothetical protein AgCh_017788 [Apium graveolens]